MSIGRTIWQRWAAFVVACAVAVQALLTGGLVGLAIAAPPAVDIFGSIICSSAPHADEDGSGGSSGTALCCLHGCPLLGAQSMPPPLGEALPAPARVLLATAPPSGPDRPDGRESDRRLAHPRAPPPAG